MSAALRPIPLVILALIAVDAALVAAPVIDYVAGRPFSRLSNLLHLGGEMTLQAWYSSAQWLLAAALFGFMLHFAYRARMCGMVPMGMLVLACLAFSIDEAVAIHEWLGDKSDALLPGGDRANTSFSRTGIWPFLFGIPVVTILVVLVVRLRHVFIPKSRRALLLLIAGLAMMFTGALVVELAANLIEPTDGYSGWLLLQHVAEEFLEMLGISLIVWSALELLRDHGFALQLPAMQPIHATRRERSGSHIGAGHPAM